MSYVITQHEPWHVEMKEPKSLVNSPCMLPLYHPFTAVVAGPTGCGKTAWVLRLIDNLREKIEPVPSRITMASISQYLTTIQRCISKKVYYN